MAGVRGLELRYPGTSHVFEMSVITVVGSAETRPQRRFAFELRGKGIGSSGLVQVIGALLPSSKVASLGEP
jgi:hypothetical protein